jgi:biopolymer transport protein ExbB
MSLETLQEFLLRGGPALLLIVGLSVVTVAIGLWRLLELFQAGVWRKGAASPNGRVAIAAKTALENPDFDREMALGDPTRIAKAELFDLRRGVRPLELIAAIAPLVGLLGTVLGMIGAFQALQEAGSGADPSVLAGGIWEALLTTAAGMAVAIPASILASWFESLAEREQVRMEDVATRVFNETPKNVAHLQQSAA